MYTSNKHYTQCNNYLFVNNSEPGQSILDVIACKPFYINIHCRDNTVAYGQIINRPTRDQHLTFRKAIDMSVLEFGLSDIRYITLSLPVLPFQHAIITQQQHTGYHVTLNDATELVGIAKAVFKDRDGVNIWQMNPGHVIKHLLVPYPGIQHQDYSPSI
ncbi:MAG: hypothetical protein PVF34_11345 [Gammaproteobacteria bacterium]